MKRSFTLLELMVAVFILVLAGGTIVFNVVEALAKVRFNESLKTIREEVQKLQLLALTYRSDMSLSFFYSQGVWKLKTQCNEAVLKQLDGQIFTLKEISYIQWQKGVLDKPLVIKILFNGDIEPHAILEISSKRSSAFLDLRTPLCIPKI